MRTILFRTGTGRRFPVQKQLHSVEHHHDGWLPPFHIQSKFCCVCLNISTLLTGLEYCLSQLDNIHIPTVGQYSVHNSQSTKKYQTLQSICGFLCWTFAAGTVCVWNESNRSWATIQIWCKLTVCFGLSYKPHDQSTSVTANVVHGFKFILQINGINLAQIGFIRYEIPCLPLLLKTLFTLVFWVSLRQKAYESRSQRQSSTLAHLAAPFQVTVGAATTTDMGNKGDDKKSKFIVVAGKLLNSIFLQLWIWIVVLVLFLCAIYGQKMTAIRIVYMTLVLVFLITFQVTNLFAILCNISVWSICCFCSFVTVVVPSMAKNYVRILGGRYWLCNVNTDHDLHVPIRRIQGILGDIFQNSIRIVRPNCDPRFNDQISISKFSPPDNKTSVWKGSKPKICSST